MKENDVVLNILNLKKYYPVKTGLLNNVFKKERKCIKAVDDISFMLRQKEILGIAGESGSGKTTTGKMLGQIDSVTSGKIFFKGLELHDMNQRERKKFYRICQMIFQDPYEALNPRFTVKRAIEEPLIIHEWKNLQNREKQVKDALYKSELQPPEEYLSRFPHELSGGQLQRVNIARGIVLEPSILIADEPVSMLDVSIRAGILNLLKNFREKMGISIIYISHDLATVKYICDRVMIMYLGKIVEIGVTKDVLDNPVHPYAQALVSAVPNPEPDGKRERPKIKGEISDQIDLPKGCRFHPRCFRCTKKCRETEPNLSKVGEGHYVACHHV